MNAQELAAAGQKTREETGTSEPMPKASEAIIPVTAIVPAENSALDRVEATTGRALLMKEKLKEEMEQRSLLIAFVRTNMKEGIDYGKIPGTGDKKNLLKPGAEKLIALFHCIARYRIVEAVRDHAAGFYYYEVEARILSHDSKARVAEGLGSCNTKESKYRWRTAERLCPECKKPNIKRSKPRDGDLNEPGWYCWAKTGGCGGNFLADDERITGQEAGRVENDDVYGVANTVLKMAKKRALVDAALALTGASDLFTQDMDDLPGVADAKVVVQEVRKEIAADRKAAAPAPSAPAPSPREESTYAKSLAPASGVPSSAPAPAPTPAVPSSQGASPPTGKPAGDPKQQRAFQALWHRVKHEFTGVGFRKWVDDQLQITKPASEITIEEIEKLDRLYTSHLEKLKAATPPQNRTDDIPY